MEQPSRPSDHHGLAKATIIMVGLAGIRHEKRDPIGPICHSQAVVPPFRPESRLFLAKATIAGVALAGINEKSEPNKRKSTRPDGLSARRVTRTVARATEHPFSGYRKSIWIHMMETRRIGRPSSPISAT
jgi:hypothetical protein